VCVLAALLAGCGPLALSGHPSPIRDAEPTSARPNAENAALEREVFDLVNRHRGARGLRLLELDARIGREARLHSIAMADGKVPLGHDGFGARVEALGRVMSCARSAENVALSRGHHNPASDVVDRWLRSRGHRTNIEGSYEATGVGVALNPNGAIYFTQIFVGGCARSGSPPVP
jgi:uncharacterized protein YkwD